MLALLSKNEGDIVIFHIWKSLRYKYRIILSLILIFTGLVFQANSMEYLPGLIFLLAGNLLLLTKGFTNKVDLGKYEPDAEWQKAEPQRLDDIILLHKKMKKWNISLFDISSSGGIFVFFIIILAIIALAITSYYIHSRPLGILAVDAFVLIVPHWYSGLRKTMTTPRVVRKIELFKALLNKSDFNYPIEIQYLMLLAGGNTKIPKDIKIKVDFQQKPEGILGLYGQVSQNEVQGKEYPYYYMVLVTKSDFELQRFCKTYQKVGQFVLDFEIKEGIQTMVIRQHTTNKSGYYTDENTQRRIFRDSVELALKIFKSSKLS